jgi:hypothetical protein
MQPNAAEELRNKRDDLDQLNKREGVNSETRLSSRI